MVWNPFSRLFGGERKSVSTLDLFRELMGGRGRTSETGRVVNAASALEVTTVFACAQVKADCIATVPCKIFRKDAAGREAQPDHPVQQILMGRANAWQTGLEYRETLGFHLALEGNHYAFKNIVSGKLAELIPFEPNSVTVKRDPQTYELSYTVRAPNGTSAVFPASAIWHVRGPSWNSWYGLETVRTARESIGLALATEENHAKLHKNGTRLGGMYSVSGTLDKDQYKALKAWIDENFAGSEHAFSTMVLDRDAKFTPVAATGVDSEHLDTRRFQIEEICRAMRVLPIMVGHSDKAATYASAEQMFLAHAQHTARPLHRRIEAAIMFGLLTPDEVKGGLYAKFMDAELLRGAAVDRAKYYQAGLGVGGGAAWLTPDEVREFEDMDPKGGDADKLPTSTTNPAATVPVP